MTRKIFKRNINLTILFLSLSIFIGVGIQIIDKSYLDLYGKTTPLILALAASWLTYCIQSRLNFHHALRNTWTKLIDGIAEAFIFSRKNNFSDEEKNKTLYKLSIAIEEIRSIFKNINESKKDPLGFYPFEPLKEIYFIIEDLNPVEDENLRLQDYEKIKILWKSMRKEFLKEFDRSKPCFTYSHWIDEEKITFLNRPS